MDEYIDREHKIKSISFIFETRYNDTLSEKVLSIINSYETLDYTVNNNGIFINLNVLSNDILDMVYYIVSDYEKEITIDEGINENINYTSYPSIDYTESFIRRKDTITYNDADSYLLKLSTRFLTI